MRSGLVALVLSVLAGAALADAPLTSWRPLPNPRALAATPVMPVTDTVSADLPFSPDLARFRPRPNPRALTEAPMAAPPVGPLLAQLPLAPDLSRFRPQPKPNLTPPNLTTLAAMSGASVPLKLGKPGARGSVCGVAGITGVTIPSIPAKARGCGLENGVKVTAVSGIPLSTPAMIDCPTAKALKKWVDQGIIPAVGRKGGGLARLEIAASYSCRPRNNQKGAKISEHGRGRAVDLAGVRLANGEVISVLKGWKSEPRMLKAMHKSACGTFGTVLGPKSDRYHQDHIHVDTARYRSGAYCR
jgi:hypothetical protein